MPLRLETKIIRGCQSDGYSVIVNGTTYDESNPTGTETLVNGGGCDSVVTVNLTFNATSTGTESYTGCTGDGYTVVVNGTTYDEANPTGTETLVNGSGCDSVVSINLAFNSTSSGTEGYSGCVGDGYSVVVNGTTYDEANPTGTETLVNSAGCDSVVSVNLTYNISTSGSESYSGCTGDGYSVVVNGTTYDESNPSGTETLTGGGGCDSIVTVALTYNATSTGNENYVGCESDGYTVVVNGTTYDESNPTGTETLINGGGCDSVVTVSLTFNPVTNGAETYSGCQGDGYSVVVNGTTYDESNPTGTETITTATCDSIVTVNLTFDATSTGNEAYAGCQGDGYSVVVNGTTYDETNPSGTETLTNGAGCDSVVTIALNYNAPSAGNEAYNGCTGDGYSVVVNGTTYDEANPNGTETLVSGNGCDSVVTVALIYNSTSTGNETYSGCQGDGYSVVVNGTTYDESNPTGSETLVNGGGCDSVVTINLAFNTTSTGTENYAGCTGDGYSVVVNGTTYDEANPTGTETLAGGNGCDSVVTVDLVFAPTSTGLETYAGCFGDGYSVVVNGTTYNEANPTGTETLVNGAGCDSVVTITLTFGNSTAGDELYSGCQGDGYSVVVNGTTYDEANPSGMELLTGSGGCDSIVTINLMFNVPTTGNELYTGCQGDGYSVDVNGTTYDEANPTGTETLVNGGGCDSVVTVALTFNATSAGNENYNGCQSDGYSVDVNGTTYNEANPTGVETLVNAVGCDSVVTIDLVYNGTSSGTESYNGCIGDGYSVVVNGTTYDETNPTGTETLVGGNGCDSVVTIDLMFSLSTAGNETYAGCQGDGYSVVVNGTTYDEANPAGTETLVSGGGCDSVVTIDLQYAPTSAGTESYVGCEGDSYSVTVNGTLYDEANPTGTEVLTGSNGCDSVVTIDLQFAQCCSPEMTTLTEEICDGEIYNFGGQMLTTAGTYQDTVTNAVGPGCDSIYTLDLSVNLLPEEDIFASICTGENYNLNGTNYSVTGMYTQTLPAAAANGCDSIINLDLMVVPSVEEIINTAICDGENYVINGVPYSVGGTHTETIANGAAGGCDSVITLNLTVNDIPVNNIIETICTGEEFIIDGTPYSVTGLYNVVITGGAATGCDSIVNLDLTVESCCVPATTNLEEDICQGETFFVNGQPFSSTGIYSVVIPDGVGPGCDSTVNLDLTVAAAVENNVFAAICDGEVYEINGMMYSVQGIYRDTLTGQAMGGCDSIIVLDLTVSNEIIENLTDEICFGEEVIINGTSYNTTGFFTETIPNGSAGGCDSTINLNLMVFDIPESFDQIDLCEGQSVTINGTAYSATGLYDITFANGSVHGCDSILHLDLEVHEEPELFLDEDICEGEFYVIDGQQFGVSGVYTVEINNGSIHGCDSTVRLDLQVHPLASQDMFVTQCEGDIFTFQDTEFSGAGAHLFYVEGVAANGCDSLYVIDITEENCCIDVTETIAESICEDEQYVLNGTMYNMTGTYMETFEDGAQNGCDSIVTLNLTVNPHLTETINASICQNETYSVGGQTFSTAGTYTVTIDGAAPITGCDSIITLNLTVDDFVQEDLSPDICMGEIFVANGIGYTMTGLYRDTIIGGAQGGCDSIIVLDLTVNDTARNDLTIVLCEGESIELNSVTYSSSGFYSDTLQNGSSTGCDSIITLDLTVLVGGLNALTTSICEGDSVQFNSIWYFTEGIYGDTIPGGAINGCDSINVLDLSVFASIDTFMTASICQGEIYDFNGMQLTTPGMYTDSTQSVSGCDSVVHLDLAWFSQPAVDAGMNQLITCQNTTVTLQGSGSAGGVLWTGPDISAANETDISPEVSIPGTYYLQITSADGCSAVDSVEVTIDPSVPIADAGPDLLVSCDILSVELFGSSTGSDLLYTWTGPGINAGNANNERPVVDSAGTYVLITIDTINACPSAADTVLVIDITNDIDAQINPSGNINCDVSLLVLDATGTTTGADIMYTWQDDMGFTIGTDVTVEVMDPGKYYFEARDTLTGCMDMDSTEVLDQTAPPAAEAGDDQELTCNITSVTLNEDGTPVNVNHVYAWTGPAGGILTDPAMLSIDVGTSGWYFLTVLDTTTGCENFDSAFVVDNAILPDAEAGADQFLTCADQVATLTADGSSEGSGFTYIWNGPSVNNASVFAIETQEPGMYYLTVINTTTGCENADSVLLEAGEFLSGASINVLDPVCQGDNSGEIDVQSVVGGVGPYMYSMDGIIFQDNPVFENVEAGIHTIVVQDANGCEWQTEVVLNDGPAIGINIGPDILLKIGEMHQLDAVIIPGADQIDSIVWTPPSGLTCINCPDPILTAISGGQIIATIYLGNTCIASDNLTLRVDRRPDIWVPNVFSPNGDDINDLVSVFAGPGIQEVAEFEIFDRWGELVFGNYSFPPNQIELGWDGRFKGEMMQPAVFVYKANVTLIDGTSAIVSGDITLVR